MHIEEITVKELKNKMDNKEAFTLIDVREPHEYNMSNIEGALHIPLGELGNELSSFNKNGYYILQCRSGKRSAADCELMQSAGFTNVVNLQGGILSWAEEIDGSLEVQ